MILAVVVFAGCSPSSQPANTTEVRKKAAVSWLENFEGQKIEPLLCEFHEVQVTPTMLSRLVRVKFRMKRQSKYVVGTSSGPFEEDVIIRLTGDGTETDFYTYSRRNVFGDDWKNGVEQEKERWGEKPR